MKAGRGPPFVFTADNRYVIFTRTQGVRGSNDIWALPLGGDRTPFPVVQTPANETNGALAPDGRWIAYQAFENAQTQIYVQPLPPTGGQFQVSKNGGGRYDGRISVSRSRCIVYWQLSRVSRRDRSAVRRGEERPLPGQRAPAAVVEF